MIGYITSSDKQGDVANPEITFIYSDDFCYGFENMPKTVYTYNRNTKDFSEVVSMDDDHRMHLYSLLGAVELLELEEMKHRLAMRVFFKDSFQHSITHVKSEYLDGIWFPSPALADGCRETCINITDFIYEKTPNTLEVSFLCDIMNMICALGKVGISAPFYCCYNSIFVDSSFLKLVCDIFGEKEFYENVSPDIESVLKFLPTFEKSRNRDVRNFLKCLEDVSYEEKEYAGTRHSFAVNVKRSCLNAVLNQFKTLLDSTVSLEEFKNSVYYEIDSAIKRFVTLSELFRVSGNLDKAEDIRFLTLYELMSAYAFGEKEITLKSSVRFGRERITHINKTKIPKVIYPDGRYI